MILNDLPQKGKDDKIKMEALTGLEPATTESHPDGENFNINSLARSQYPHRDGINTGKSTQSSKISPVNVKLYSQKLEPLVEKLY